MANQNTDRFSTEEYNCHEDFSYCNGQYDFDYFSNHESSKRVLRFNGMEFSVVTCKQDENGKGIPPIIRKPVEIWSWDMNMGKTYQQRRFILQNRNLRHIYIVPTIALAKEASNRLGIPCYTDLECDSEWREGSLVVAMASYHKVRGNIDCLYIDEIESCLGQLTSKKIFTKSTTDCTHRTLIEDIRTCEKVVLMDAHVGSPSFHLISEADRVPDCQILECSGPPVTWVDVGSHKDHIHLLMQKVKNNSKLSIACSSKSKVIELYELLCKYVPDLDIRHFHSDNHEEGKKRYPRNTYICDVLIYNNVIGSGISIDIENHYDERHILIYERTGDARIMQQMSQRVRNPKDQRIYFSGNKGNLDSTRIKTEFSPERIYHQWCFGNQEKIRKIKQFNIEMSRHMDKDPRKMSLLRMLAIIESTAMNQGKKCACGWLRNHLPNVIKYSGKIEKSSNIANDKRIIKERRKKERAQKIYEAPSVSTEEIYKIEQKSGRTEKELHILERNRLESEFGLAFTGENKERQLQIIEDDENKKLTQQVLYFAGLNLMKTEYGPTILALHERNQLEHTLPIHLSHLLEKVEFFYEILHILDIHFNDDEPNEIDKYSEKLKEAVDWSRKQSDKLKRIGITPPGALESIQWLDTIFSQFGVKWCCRGKDQKSLANGEKIRVRVYSIKMHTYHRMKKLSQHQQGRLESRYKYDAESIIQENDVGFESTEMSTSNIMNILKKEVDTHLDSLFHAEIKDAQGFLTLIQPSKKLLKKSLEAEEFTVDLKKWEQVTKERKREGKERTSGEYWIEERVKKNKPLRFDKTATRIRCPRRYPEVENSNSSETILLSSVPRELRETFIPLGKGEIFDFDMKCANLSILANISKDEDMRDWLKGDPHQSTGDYLLKDQKLSKVQRRKIGKIINNSLIAGGGTYRIKEELKKYKKDISEKKAQIIVDDWWDRFPKAKAFREEHRLMIAQKVKNGEHHYFYNSGERKFFYTAEFLSGKEEKEGGLKTIEGRKQQAERSAFTGLLRAYESMIMDHVFVKAHQLGLKLICPMFDGALFLIPKKNS